MVSLEDWSYEKSSGVGGSGAYMILTSENIQEALEKELNLGVGWQDPAVINETGLCVWKSGLKPQLEMKTDGSFVKGKLAL
eukprot:CAMPEP_0116981776 /NCGR_PEP_ID=MMETSP0467-20121206/59929_1 /TAXON_ID=283647 /ORGANISM="Mesodinium pulex, Strain SPMC105" /LENGTH=80 /DNA_ID=CAMNT_0004676103 /DNA_START=252 /DNA_END=494 /DNA_ORIENTATION=-